MNNEIKNNIEKATITIINKGGKGVLVNDNLIITAAHCINFEVDGSMGLGEFFIEPIKTIIGEIKVSVIAVEPVSDVAILGCIDNNLNLEEAMKFESFCEKVKPLKLYRGDFELFEEYPVHIFTHEAKWISGNIVKVLNETSKLVLNTENTIESGTSGSPVLNEIGELVGVVSNSAFGSNDQFKSGNIPFVRYALPVWIYNRIK
jgi:hypothetical protein